MFARLLPLVLLLSLVAGCGSPQAKPLTADAVVAAFKAAGLEAESVRPLTRDDYGLAPYVGSGVRFLIPSLGADNGGRIFIAQPAEVERLQTYYTDLGKQSAAFYSHIYRRDTVLVQINGRLPDDRAALYEAALRGIR